MTRRCLGDAWSVVGGGALLLVTAACAAGPPPPKPLNPVRFLSVNDLETVDTRSDSGGVARVATVRRRIAAEGRVVFVVAGDFLSVGGDRMIEALNAAKVDYVTFGNDELRLDRATLARHIQASRFKWLSGNCALAGDTAFGKVARWDTLRVSTHKVGIFGLTARGVHGDYVQCGDPDSAARRLIDTLAAVGADLIVAVTHQPAEEDRDLLLRESRLDLIVGGYEGTARDLVISGRHALRADSDARTAQFVTLWGGKGDWRQAVGLIPIDARLPADTAVARATNSNPG